MRRSIFLAAVMLSVVACGSSAEQPSASSQSTISGSTTGTEAVAVTNADAALDTSAAVATLRAIATAAASVGRDGGDDIGVAGDCPFGVDSQEWAAEAAGAVFCERESGDGVEVWFAGMVSDFAPLDVLTVQGIGGEVVSSDRGPHAGGVLATHCIESGFTPESFPIPGRCVAMWTSGDLVVGLFQGPTDDPDPLVDRLTVQLPEMLGGLASLDTTTLDL